MTPLTDEKSFDTLYQDFEEILEDYCGRQSPELEYDWEGEEVKISIDELDDKGKEHAEEIVKSLENLQIAGSKPYFYEEVDKENKHNLNYKIGVLRLDS